MKPQKFFSIAHKYLALIIGAQIFLWVGSGLFFSIVPIEKIRGEHLVNERPRQNLNADDFTALPMVLNQKKDTQKVKIYKNISGSIIEIDNEYFDGKTGQIKIIYQKKRQL